MERSRQNEGKLNPNRMMGIYCALCYVSGGQSLQNTEIGDSLVVRAIKQQESIVVSSQQPLAGCLG